MSGCVSNRLISPTFWSWSRSRFRDDRGLFTRTFDAEIFDDYLGVPGAAASFVQDSQSRSRAGRDPRACTAARGRGEAKLVRCANGAVHDVLVDIRRGFADLRPAAVVSARRQRFSPPLRAARISARLPGAHRTADVCYRIDRPHDPAEDLAVALRRPGPRDRPGPCR